MWHDPRTISGMSLLRLWFVVALCALPCTAAAQPWADAYRAGDYKTAADLLHPLVIQMAMQPDSGNPEPPRHLATMYAEGLGMPRDPIVACALAHIVSLATAFGSARYAHIAGAYDQARKDAAAFESKLCGGLSEWDRLSADASTGCFAFGMPEEVYTLGARAVRVGRGGIHLADVLEDRPTNLQNCLQLIARVRPLTILPSSDAAPEVNPRYFVELLAWQGGHKPGDSNPRYVLQWQLYEVRGKNIEIVAMEELDLTDRWPAPALPQNFDARFTLEMIRSGHVRWRMDGAPPKRGWIMLPEEKAR